MKHGETEKRQYIFKPLIYFHAVDDQEAQHRLHAIKRNVEQGLADDLTAAPDYTYPDIGFDDESLTADAFFGEPARVVPRHTSQKTPMSPDERRAFGA